MEQTRYALAALLGGDGKEWLDVLGEIGVLALAAFTALAGALLLIGIAVRLLAAVGLRRFAWRVTQWRWLEPRLDDRLCKRSLRRGVICAVDLVNLPYRTPLQVEELVVPQGIQASGLAALLSDGVGLLGAVAVSGVDLTTPAVGTKSLIDEVSASLANLPQAKPLAAVLSIVWLLLRPQKLTLRTSVLAPGQRGLGLSLTLVDGRGRVQEAVTLWEETYHPRLRRASADSPGVAASILPRMVLAAAAWAEYKVLELRGDRRVTPLGTSDWESYALCDAGVEAQVEGRPDEARLLYSRALNHDESNLHALFNLGVLDRRAAAAAGDERRRARALKRLNRAGQCARSDESSPFERHPLWYQAAYNVMLSHLEAASQEPADNWAVLLQAWQEGRELVRTLEKALIQFDQAKRRGKSAKNRRKLLRAIEGPALVTLAAVLLEHRLQMDSSAGTSGKDIEEKGWRQQLIDELKPPLPGETPLTPARLTEKYVEGGCVILDHRTRYNLACYYARQGEDGAKTALMHLAYALESGERRDWARRDPALLNLREHHAEAFAASLE